jgi:hypothetical protein
MQSCLYSPPNKGYPQELPNQWRLPDGTWQIGLQSLDDQQLAELGWIGPIEFPDINYLTHEMIWNETTRSFDVRQRDVPLPEPIKEPIPEPLIPVDYNMFWDNLLGSTIYTTLKSASANNLAINAVCTEFLILLADAKFGKPNEGAIQTSINQILTSLIFTEEELIEVQSLFKVTGLDRVYTLA